MKKTFDGNIETDPADTLAKAVYDAVTGKTFVSMSITRYGQNVLAVVIYDD